MPLWWFTYGPALSFEKVLDNVLYGFRAKALNPEPYKGFRWWWWALGTLGLGSRRSGGTGVSVLAAIGLTAAQFFKDLGIIQC